MVAPLALSPKGYQKSLSSSYGFNSDATPLMSDYLRKRRRAKCGRKWHIDETYLKIEGRWHYLYRCIDGEDNLVDVLLSKQRDMVSAKQFFQQALAIAGQPPLQVTTDGHDSYPRAIKEVLGKEVIHRHNLYLNNRIEQDHRAIKQRYYPMRGFGSFDSANRFCSAFEEVLYHFRYRTKANEKVSLSEQREHLLEQGAALTSLFNAA